MKKELTSRFGGSKSLNKCRNSSSFLNRFYNLYTINI